MLSKTAWRLMKSYWKSKEKWRARGLLAGVIALSLGQVYMLVMLNQWNNVFYNALQERDFEVFWPLIGQFSLIAFGYIIMAVYAIYVKQILEIKWRTWMTSRYLDEWMHSQTYYRLQVLGGDGVDNPDQRISDDIGMFVNLTLSLFIGLLKQVSTLVAFVVILWQLSGALDIPVGDTVLSVPGYMVFVTLIYSVVGTWLAHKVGRSLIGLNYDQQRYEADFRFSMVRVRENSESIAFYGGEGPEMQNFQERFGMVIRNFWALMKRTKLLNFYVNGYAQLAVIVPILMSAPKYFSGDMQLGGFIQTLSAFGRVQDALSYFVEAYDTIAQYVAVIRRLGGFTGHMEAAENMQASFGFDSRDDINGLVLQDVQVELPDGRRLFEGLSLAVPAGKYLLVSGNSGCGKSTLLRALAGIWPYGCGNVSLPSGWRSMFLPQRPYLPLGSLRRAIYYPQPVPENESADLRELLERFGIGRLADRLDEVDDWSRILSLGEQQRLAFIRILLFRPDIVFLDESTSAMDEQREAEAYDILKELLPEMAVISVGHRSTLFKKHDKRLQLTGSGWQLSPLAEQLAR
ncbi:MAG: ABC transporter ATP-binding protein/permease [Anaerovibrio sp.]|uniref:ABC transporter ATP-binding protein/permease n=1 Tax=Anaerovibrio slackiae TaxID=2652309 RepID=A0A6I2UG52_9FIRM|nr:MULTISPECIES: ABC transporter ATP-binding protein/permease [Anaerovibrio]MBQ2008959.1 ABC transporter ATP-binding protein/permease [Selenomonadaceae bacterium]MBQ5585332.1 ABC transporter ATP-binding protein/permease [Selenomonadaceae bacterium]MBQ5650173.1 ABC transporter ATP-binding protein/permease [Selenomonadaceae bacterium]MBQ5733637.1 ABC transporter ATP-binding protein/permease [Selenomonadaceae bacterium]MBQ5821635.1 ABC transporter ATP-binding protein/permease [Selenomonadaceae ba